MIVLLLAWSVLCHTSWDQCVVSYSSVSSTSCSNFFFCFHRILGTKSYRIQLTMWAAVTRATRNNLLNLHLLLPIHLLPSCPRSLTPSTLVILPPCTPSSPTLPLQAPDPHLTTPKSSLSRPTTVWVGRHPIAPYRIAIMHHTWREQHFLPHYSSPALATSGCGWSLGTTNKSVSSLWTWNLVCVVHCMFHYEAVVRTPSLVL